MILTSKQVTELKEQLREYLGEAVCAALVDPTVMEVKVGEDGILHVEQQGKGWVKIGGYLSEARRRLALNISARLLNKTFNAQHSKLSGDEPLYGHRLQGFCPPTGNYTIHIRRHAPTNFTFADYIASGIMTPWQVATLCEHITKRSNILFAGATGSGKTALMGAAIAFLVESNEHGVLLEDTKEIHCEMPNFTRFLTSDDVTMEDLVKDVMRVKPSRIIIGETRGREFIAVQEAFMTGHRGCMTTLHADSAEATFTRGAVLGRKAGLPPEETWALMREALDVIVYIEVLPNKQRIVSQIKEVKKDGVTRKGERWLSQPEPLQGEAFTQ